MAAVELAVSPPFGKRLALIRTADEEIFASSAMLVLDALDRPRAHRVRAKCPPLAPGERASIVAQLERSAPKPGAGEDAASIGAEVFAWVDPDDEILEAREGNNVSSTRADAQRWTQAALHLHSSFSEGAGSVDWQAALASRSGYDLLAWSEHDWRIACVDHVRRVGFEESERIELVTRADSGSAAGAVSAEAAEGRRALRLAAAPDRSSRAFADLEADQRRLTYSLASGVTFSFQARARAFARGDRLRVVISLSHHPRETRRLVFEYGAEELASERWTKLEIPLTRAAEERWVNGGDDNVTGIRFELVSEGGGAEVLVDDLEVTHGECGAALRRIQESWMRFYPNLAHFFADEISGQRTHLNQYGGVRGLFDSARGEEASYVKDVVDRVHAAGGLVSWCHPFGVRTGPGVRERFDAAYRDSLIAARIGGTDVLEVGFRAKASEQVEGYLRFWDEAGLRGIATTGIGVNDSHETEWGAWENNFATWIEAPAQDAAAILRALGAGHAFFGDPIRFRGRLGIESDGRAAGDRQSAEGTRRVHVHVTGAPERSKIALVVDGERVREWSGVAGERSVAHELRRGEGGVVRAELWSEDGHPLAFTNPIYSTATRARE